MDDEDVTRIYVESPIFTEEDKNTYKFIDPDIGLSEDLTERYNREDEREITKTDHYKEISFHLADPPIHLFQDFDIQALKSTNSRATSASKHSVQRPSDKHEHPSYNNNSTNITLTEVKQMKPKEFEKPTTVQKDYLNLLSDHKLKRMKDQEEEKLISAERLQNEKKESERNNVPQLHLIDSDDERVIPFKDSLDLETHGSVTMTNGNYAKSVVTAKNEFIKDSLDADQLIKSHPTAKDSLIIGDKHFNGYQFSNNDNESHSKTKTMDVKPEFTSYQDYRAKHKTQFALDADDVSLLNRLSEPWPHNSDAQLVLPSNTPAKNVRWESMQEKNNNNNNNGAASETLKTKERKVSIEKKKSYLQQTHPVLPSKDFVEANRIQLAKPTKKSYGQMYAKKANKENESNAAQTNGRRVEETIKMNGDYEDAYTSNQYNQGDLREDEWSQNWNNENNGYTAANSEEFYRNNSSWTEPGRTGGQTIGHENVPGCQYYDQQFNNEIDFSPGRSQPAFMKIAAAKAQLSGPEAVWHARSGSLGRRIDHGENRRASAEASGGSGFKKQGLAFGRGNLATKQGGSSAPNRRRPQPNGASHGAPQPVSPAERRAGQGQQSSKGLVTRRAYSQPAIHVNQHVPKTIHHTFATPDGQIVDVDVNFKMATTGPQTRPQIISNNNNIQGFNPMTSSIKNQHQNASNDEVNSYRQNYQQLTPGRPVSLGDISPRSPVYEPTPRMAFADPYSPQVNYIFSGANAAGKALAYQEELGTRYSYPVPNMFEMNAWNETHPLRPYQPFQLPAPPTPSFSPPSQGLSPYMKLPPVSNSDSFTPMDANPQFVASTRVQPVIAPPPPSQPSSAPPPVAKTRVHPAIAPPPPSQPLSAPPPVAKTRVHPAIAPPPITKFRVHPVIAPPPPPQSLFAPSPPPQRLVESSVTKVIDNGGSYLQQYLDTKNKQHIDYKEYTLDDYRKLQKVEQHRKLGTLGPDLENDDLRERREKIQRQQEYANEIKKRHIAETKLAALKQKHMEAETYGNLEAEKSGVDLLGSGGTGEIGMGVGRQKKFSTTGPDPAGRDRDAEVLDKRKLALEYSKKVPKPKVIPRSSATESSSPGRIDASKADQGLPVGVGKKSGMKNGAHMPLGSSTTDGEFVVKEFDFDYNQLLELCQRHEQERRKVAQLLTN